MEKFFRPVIFALAIMLTGCFTSCSIDNDDDSSNTKKILTSLERKEQVAAIAGNYQGKIYFTNDTTMQIDSINCNWQVTAPDSMLRMADFPVSVFAMGIRNVEARKVLLNGGVTEFRGTLFPYVNDYVEKGYYTFWMEPVDYVLNFNVDLEGTSHTVKVDFTNQMYAYASTGSTAIFYSVGEYYNHKLLSYILVKDVVVDGMPFDTGWTTYIYGEKSQIP